MIFIIVIKSKGSIIKVTCSTFEDFFIKSKVIDCVGYYLSDQLTNNVIQPILVKAGINKHIVMFLMLFIL